MFTIVRRRTVIEIVVPRPDDADELTKQATSDRRNRTILLPGDESRCAFFVVNLERDVIARYCI